MHAVQTSDLTIHLGEVEALSGVSCCIQEGEFVAILGPNGAGKSTLLKVLLGLLRPDAGEVLVFERAPEKVPSDWIGYVPQIKTLDRSFPAIVLELVITGLRHSWARRLRQADKKKALETLELVGAVHLAQRAIGSLSGGELQRVYLARSLVRHPRLILLDEPVTGIDTLGESDFYHILGGYRHVTKATILMVTHDWEVASRHAQRVMVLNHRIISFGPPAEALCEECLRQAYGKPDLAARHELRGGLPHA
ncbi:MAG: ABC transporter ATP-binding protein [Deltaproteobacteria bacterium]|jgi:zinc transport system ATP-binding protein